LTTISVGGTTLNNLNMVTSFTAGNSGTTPLGIPLNDIALRNTSASLLITGISQTGMSQTADGMIGGNIFVSTSGTLNIGGGAVDASSGHGNIFLTAGSSINEMTGGTVSGGVLTTSSVGGTMLKNVNTVSR